MRETGLVFQSVSISPKRSPRKLKGSPKKNPGLEVHEPVISPFSADQPSRDQLPSLRENSQAQKIHSFAQTSKGNHFRSTTTSFPLESKIDQTASKNAQNSDNMRSFRQYKHKIDQFIGVSEGMKRVKPARIEPEDFEFDSNAIDEFLG